MRFESYYLAFLYVFWKQATPSQSEIAALYRIAPELQSMSLAEVGALLKDEECWRLGPLEKEEEANALTERLRAAGFVVEMKRE